MQNDDLQRIEAWLDGAMNAEERAAFESRMREDAALAAEVQLHRDIRQAFREKELNVFRQTVDGMITEVSGSAGLTFRISRFAWATAATVLLAVAAIWFMRSREDRNTAQLYAAAFQPPPEFGYNLLRFNADRDTSQQVASNPWFQLNKDWSANKPAEALEWALKIAQSDTSVIASQSAWYAAGVIALTQKDAETALRYLERAGDVQPYRESIEWYTALALVQRCTDDDKQCAVAREALKKVSENKNQIDNRRNWSRALLKSLEK